MVRHWIGYLNAADPLNLLGKSLTNTAVSAHSIRTHPKTALRPDIQGLRAVAVLAVMADHLMGRPSGGFVGVDIFFVISGFLITGHLMREWEKRGRISFAGFYKRRVKRILPAAVLVLIATVSASFFLLNRTRAWSVLWDGAWAAIFGANWRFATAGTDYFQADGPTSPLQHYWSLAVEEQFYFVWPWIMLGVLVLVTRSQWSERPRVAAAVLITVISAASLAWAFFETTSAPTVAYFSTFSRTWELGIGAILALCTPLLQKINDHARPLLAWVGLLGITASLFVIDAGSAFPAPAALFPVLATGTVIAAGTGGAQRFLAPLTNRAATYTGDISYSLYLWHFPVVILLGGFMDGGRRFLLIAIALTFVLAVHSYHLVEDPIRQSGWLTGTAKGALPSGYRNLLASAGSLVICLTLISVAAATLTPVQQQVVGTAPKADSSPSLPFADLSSGERSLQEEIVAATKMSRFPETHPDLQDVDAWMAEEMKGSSGCLNPVDMSDTDACTYGTGDKLAMVVGDSVAMSWIPAVRSALEPAGYRVHGVGISNCPFADVTITIDKDPAGTKKCNNSKQDIAKQIEQLAPDLVIATDFEFNIVRQDLPTEEAMLKGWTDGLTRSIEMARGHGAEVVILSPNPAGAAAEVCITPFSAPVDCVQPIAGSWHQKRGAEMEAASTTGARYVDARKWFCTPEQVCPLVVGNTAVRSDIIHLSGQYAAKIGPLIVDDLLGR